jgi:hypothetical protein
MSVGSTQSERSKESITTFFNKVKESGTLAYIRNSNNDIDLLITPDGVPLPSTINRQYKMGTTYILSFLSQFVDYATEELSHDRSIPLIKRLITRGFLSLLRAAGIFMMLDKIVFVNNRLLSTSLQPDISRRDFEVILDTIRLKFPDYSIVFRGVTPATSLNNAAHLRGLGAIPIISRLVYLFNPKVIDFKKKRAFIRDKKMAQKLSSELYWTVPANLEPVERQRILQLYQELYLNKYSKLNPQYTDRFIEESAASGLLTYYLLRRKSDDKLLAVQAVSRVENQITTPFIGYDMSEPKELGLYRLMNIKLMQIAIEQDLLLNMSSGAGMFKSQRGGIPGPEYHMVFPPRKSIFRRSIWRLLSVLSEKIIIPSLIKNKV